MTDIDQIPSNLRRMLEFIQGYIRDRGYAPSVRDIGGALGIQSTSTVHAQLRRLEEAGFLKRDPSKPRAMVLQMGHPKPGSGVWLPDGAFSGLTGQSEQPFSDAAPEPLPFVAFDDIAGAFSAPDALPTGPAHAQWTIPGVAPLGRPCFVTAMPDDSMAYRQISAGDYLIVSRQDSANNNDIIIGSLAHATLIRSYTKGLRQVRLQVESNDLAIVTVDPEELTIFGVVVGCLHMLA
jgi:repressor LexA